MQPGNGQAFGLGAPWCHVMPSWYGWSCMFRNWDVSMLVASFSWDPRGGAVDARCKHVVVQYLFGWLTMSCSQAMAQPFILVTMMLQLVMSMCNCSFMDAQYDGSMCWDWAGGGQCLCPISQCSVWSWLSICLHLPSFDLLHLGLWACGGWGSHGPGWTHQHKGFNNTQKPVHVFKLNYYRSLIIYIYKDVSEWCLFDILYILVYYIYIYYSYILGLSFAWYTTCLISSVSHTTHMNEKPSSKVNTRICKWGVMFVHQGQKWIDGFNQVEAITSKTYNK